MVSKLELESKLPSLQSNPGSILAPRLNTVSKLELESKFPTLQSNPGSILAPRLNTVSKLEIVSGITNSTYEASHIFCPLFILTRLPNVSQYMGRFVP